MSNKQKKIFFSHQKLPSQGLGQIPLTSVYWHQKNNIKSISDVPYSPLW